MTEPCPQDLDEGDSSIVHHHFIKAALQPLVAMLLEQLTKQVCFNTLKHQSTKYFVKILKLFDLSRAGPDGSYMMRFQRKRTL